MAGDFMAEAVNGPTTQDGLPPFSWDKYSSISHQGLPQFYNFTFVKMKPLLFKPWWAVRLTRITWPNPTGVKLESNLILWMTCLSLRLSLKAQMHCLCLRDAACVNGSDPSIGPDRFPFSCPFMWHFILKRKQNLSGLFPLFPSFPQRLLVSILLKQRTAVEDSGQCSGLKSILITESKHLTIFIPNNICF